LSEILERVEGLDTSTIQDGIKRAALECLNNYYLFEKGGGIITYILPMLTPDEQSYT